MMAVEAARRLTNESVCFVGIGLPSVAANLARRTHAPGCVLVYESGTIGAKPTALPLSIGDGELAETADTVVSVPEMFAYWLQGGRIDIGFLGAAQIDRHGNLNSTVIGDYATPKVRLPGGGGAPEIATSVSEVFVMLRQSPRAFVERLDFKTSRGDRVRVVVTDLGDPRAARRRAELVRVHPGVSVDDARAATGWELRIATGRGRDRAPVARRARRPARPRDEGARVSGESPIVLPDDPSFGDEVQVDYPGYRSTRLRAPKRPLVTLPEELHPVGGPVFGDETVSELDYDLTQQHDGEPLGERIIVAGRVLDAAGKPVREHARRDLAGERGRPLPARGRSASGAARPELLGRRPLPHRRRRQLPLRHREARRLPVGQPRERVAAGAHPLLRLRPGVHAAAGHADVLPRRSAVRVRPDLPLGPRPEGARSCSSRSSTSTTRSQTGRSPIAGTSCSATAETARHRSRRTHDAAADPVADRRAVLLDRALPASRERARPGRRSRGDPG